MMFKKLYEEWLLMVSDDPRDVFLYMNQSELFGTKIENCRDKDVIVDISPVHDKPFIFLNKKTLCELPIWKASTLIMQSCFELCELLSQDVHWKDDKKKKKFLAMTSRSYAELIMKELNFPDIYFLIQT